MWYCEWNKGDGNGRHRVSDLHRCEEPRDRPLTDMRGVIFVAHGEEAVKCGEAGPRNGFDERGGLAEGEEALDGVAVLGQLDDRQTFDLVLVRR